MKTSGGSAGTTPEWFSEGKTLMKARIFSQNIKRYILKLIVKKVVYSSIMSTKS